MEAMLTSAIAILGTLGGAFVAGALQARSAARTEHAARAEALRTRQEQAATALIRALIAHRRTLYTRWRMKVDAAPADRQAAARWESWSTRSEVADAQAALRMVTGDREILHHADGAIGASYALSDVTDATTQADMDARGDAARAAHAAFVAAAAAYINGV